MIFVCRVAYFYFNNIEGGRATLIWEANNVYIANEGKKIFFLIRNLFLVSDNFTVNVACD